MIKKIINGIAYDLNEVDIRDRERREKIAYEINKEEEIRINRKNLQVRQARTKLKTIGLDETTIDVLLGDYDQTD